MRRRIWIALFPGILISLLPHNLGAAELTLDGYMRQVESAHQGLQASRVAQEAAKERHGEADLALTPNLFATLQGTMDKKQQATLVQADKTEVESVNIGVSKLTDFGLTGKVYYNTSHTQLYGTDPRMVATPKFYDMAPTLEVAQSLWKNRGGEDIKNTIEVQNAQLSVTENTEQFKRQMTYLEAESAYWRLALAREAVRMQIDATSRANKLLEWTRSKVRDQLADEADLVQAQAVQEMRSLELQMAKDEEQAASAAFNTARGLAQSQVSENLARLSDELLQNYPVPQKTSERLDVTAAKEALRLSQANMELSSSKYTPSLDAFGLLALNGHDQELAKTAKGSLSTSHPTVTIGLRLNAPLGAEPISRVRGGLAKEKQAAELNFSRKKFESDREWEDLERKLHETRKRLDLSSRIVVAQKQKLDAEKKRQQTGRSTTFQVLTFEGDYATAELNHIRTKAEILGTIARMKTFGGAK